MPSAWLQYQWRRSEIAFCSAYLEQEISSQIKAETGNTQNMSTEPWRTPWSLQNERDRSFVSVRNKFPRKHPHTRLYFSTRFVKRKRCFLHPCFSRLLRDYTHLHLCNKRSKPFIASFIWSFGKTRRRSLLLCLKERPFSAENYLLDEHCQLYLEFICTNPGWSHLLCNCLLFTRLMSHVVNKPSRLTGLGISPQSWKQMLISQRYITSGRYCMLKRTSSP